MEAQLIKAKNGIQFKETVSILINDEFGAKIQEDNLENWSASVPMEDDKEDDSDDEVPDDIDIWEAEKDGDGSKDQDQLDPKDEDAADQRPEEVVKKLSIDKKVREKP